MAAIDGAYDQNAEPNSNGIMPEHECTAEITESDFKSTKAGTGKYISLTVSLLDGPYQGRKLWAILNLENPSKQARDIGNAEFAAVRVALFGTKDKVVRNTEELHGIPCKIKVGIKTDKDTRERSNFIKKWIGNGATSADATPSEGKPWATTPDKGTRF